GRQVEKNRLGNGDGANGLIVQRLPSGPAMDKNQKYPPSTKGSQFDNQLTVDISLSLSLVLER
ncbi:hypothetical protein ABNM11_27475, partial [Pseudomonas syringae]